MSPLHVFCIACLAAFGVAVVVRAWRLAHLPTHMRWELYPVAHEKDRAHYGGSYLEASDWWTKPRESSRLGELRVMVPEILWLHGVKASNGSMWWRTWPFHFGLYLLIGTSVLLFAGGLLGWTAPGGLLGTAIAVLGYAGLGLALFGATALLLRRVGNPDYRAYSKGTDYLNLTAFAAAAGVALLGHLLADPDFLRIRTFFAGFFGRGPAPLGALQTTAVVLFALLTMYVPLTHMSHFFTKWFMYHDIRWGDEPLNEKISARIGKELQRRPTWSAPHIGADGKRTWGEIAMDDGLEHDEK